MGRGKENSIADMIDLGIRIDPIQDTNAFSLRAELRAGFAELYCPDQKICFRAAVKKLVIRLELEGLEFEAGPRPHDLLRTNGPLTKTTEKSEVKDEKKLSGGFNSKLSTSGSSDLSTEIAAQAGRSWTNSKTVETSSEDKPQYVIARPGDRWEVHDREQGYLNATYLVDNQALCSLLSIPKSNRKSAVATAEISQKDLHIEFEKANLAKRMTVNKHRLASIVFAKNMSKTDRPYNGKIFLSRAIDEDD